MTLPRRVVAGAIQFVTRRTSLRRFLLVPTAEIHALLLYCAAVAAQRYGIQLHAFAWMSNHVHFVLTDPRGNLPSFMRWFCHNTSCALNRRYGRTGKDVVWDPTGSYDNVRLWDAAVVEQKLLYTLLNPVAAGLVPRAQDWHGGVSLPQHFGRTLTVRRPKGYFRQKGPTALPETVELTLTRPYLLDELYPTDRRYREALAKQLSQAERERQQEFKRAKRRFLGLAAARRVEPQTQPRNFDSLEATRLVWPFQCSDPIFRDHLEEDHLRFLTEAVETFPVWNDEATRPSAVFPHGSYRWVRLHGARVAPRPDWDPAPP
ncbi:MAG: transposase [Planctomycetota bacterium]